MKPLVKGVIAMAKRGRPKKAKPAKKWGSVGAPGSAKRRKHLAKIRPK